MPPQFGYQPPGGIPFQDPKQMLAMALMQSAGQFFGQDYGGNALGSGLGALGQALQQAQQQQLQQAILARSIGRQDAADTRSDEYLRLRQESAAQAEKDRKRRRRQGRRETKATQAQIDAENARIQAYFQANPGEAKRLSLASRDAILKEIDERARAEPEKPTPALSDSGARSLSKTLKGELETIAQRVGQEALASSSGGAAGGALANLGVDAERMLREIGVADDDADSDSDVVGGDVEGGRGVSVKPRQGFIESGKKAVVTSEMQDILAKGRREIEAMLQEAKTREDPDSFIENAMAQIRAEVERQLRSRAGLLADVDPLLP